MKIGSITPFGLRLHPDLKRRLEDAARRSGRSLNAEIAARLEASLIVDEDARSEDAARRLLRSGMGDDLEKRLGELEARVEHLEQAAR
ncbi:hypothetical protein A6U87_14745 [Rhizobium sp. AC44/96]|nr:hypothetical protein A6U87_14745 [Rhizobium sp. AC44/96]